jgi:hypothetical protein
MRTDAHRALGECRQCNEAEAETKRYKHTKEPIEHADLPDSLAALLV